MSDQNSDDNEFDANFNSEYDQLDFQLGVDDNDYEVDIYGDREEYIAGLREKLRGSDNEEIISTLEFFSTMLMGGPSLAVMDFLGVAFDISDTIIETLGDSDDTHVQLLASRCLFCIYEGMPDRAPKVFIDNGILSILSSKFENITYIDLIEHILPLLRSLAVANAPEVLRSECLVPLVKLLDFFGSYYQTTIMSIIEVCAAKIDRTTAGSARILLSILTSPPNGTTLKCTTLLIAMIAPYQDESNDNLVSDETWNVLISSIKPNAPHLDSLLHAVENLIKYEKNRIPQLVELAERVTYAICQKRGLDGYDPEMLTSIASCGHSTLQHAVNIFVSLFTSTEKMLTYDNQELYRCATIVIPVASTVNLYFSKIISVNNYSNIDRKHQIFRVGDENQLLATSPIVAARYCVKAMLHRLRTCDNDLTRFSKTVEELRIFDFLHEVLSTCIGLNDIGVEIALDLTYSSPSVKKALKVSGIAEEISEYMERLQNSLYMNQKGIIEPGQDRTSANNSFKLCQSVVDAIQPENNHSKRVVDEALECISNGTDLDFDGLKHVAADKLFRSGLFDALANRGIQNYFGLPLLRFLLASLERIETFPVTKSAIPPSAVTQPLNVRIMKLTVKPLISDPDTVSPTFNFSLSAFAAVEALEQFLKVELMHTRRNMPAARPSATSIMEADAYIDRTIVFYNRSNKRIPPGTCILKAVNGQNESTLYYKQLERNNRETEAAEFEDFKDPHNDVSSEQAIIMKLLQQLASFNYESGTLIAWENFNSHKLSTKLMVQLGDLDVVLAKMIPEWITKLIHDLPFLFALSLRCYYVHLVSLKLHNDPSIQQTRFASMLDPADYDTQETGIRPRGFHRRQRFRISRDSFFGSAIILLEKSSHSTNVVEVLFMGEDGVGKGPTQEFFSLISKEYSSITTEMWNLTSNGLFFKPYTSCPEHISIRFRGLGMLLARAFLDRRMLDFRFSPVFFECIVSKYTLSKYTPSVELLRKVDPELAETLANIKSAPANDIASMGLDFTVPGTGEELLPSGADIPVSKDNYLDYIKLTCNFFLGSGISEQIKSFIEGFESLVDFSELWCFTNDELTRICGWDDHQDWTTEALKNAIVPEQGYNSEDPIFNNFIEVLHSFDHTERRLFLMFTTGSPSLPLGGFKSLKPPLTIAVKYPDDESLSSDIYLPSVMTCANYFRLPRYSSKEIMKSRLLKAFVDGANTFPLS